MLGAIDSDAYQIVLILHILTVVVGLGAVFLNGVYGAQAKARRGAEGLAIAQANLHVTRIAEWIIYAILPTGLALVLMSETDGTRVYDFDQTWVWLSIVLYVVALGIAHGVMFPTVRRMHALMAELNAMGPPPGEGGPPHGAGGPPLAGGGPPPQAVELTALGKRVGMGGAVLNVLTVALVALMVWKPGL